MNYPTQNDVARLAKVSQAAVAAALGKTDKVRISEETRARILRAAEQLNYTPHRSASAVRSGRTRQVAVILSGTLLQTVGWRTRHLASFLGAEGYSVILRELEWANSTLQQAWEEALEARVEGVVLSNGSQIPAEMKKKLARSPIPVVSLCGPDIPGIPLVAPDLRHAFRELTIHLLQSGRKKLRLLVVKHASDVSKKDSWKRRERVAGFQEAAHQCGKEAACELFEIYDSGRFDDHQLGATGLSTLLETGRRRAPDALLCSNDNLALGALSEATRRGLNIPRDLAITGCDGESWTGFGAIPITTIEQPAEALARAAADSLLKMMRGHKPASTHIHLPCQIHHRLSSHSRP